MSSIIRSSFAQHTVSSIGTAATLSNGSAFLVACSIDVRHGQAS